MPRASDPVAAAAVEAMMEARWEASDLLSRRPPPLACDLLQGHAAELAGSAIAHDQVLSLALDAAARDLAAGRAPLADGALFLFQEPAPEPAARQAVREGALREDGVPLADSHRVAEEIEERRRREGGEPGELAGRLVAEARLHELMWDDPRLPATSRTRLVMLCSAARLIERAEALTPDRRLGLRPRDEAHEAFGRLDANLRRRPMSSPAGWRSGFRSRRRPAHEDAPLTMAACWALLAGLFAVALAGLIGVD
jgi:hypothetical protein